MKIETSLLENWLLKYENTPINLGESGVASVSFGELINLTSSSIEEINQLSLENNDTYGSLELRKAISSFYKNPSLDSILVTAGTTEAILLYFNIRYQPGANVVVPVPAFHILYEVPAHLGYEVRLLQLHPKNNFHLNLEELEKLVDDETTTIVLNSPHNPTGIVYSEQEIKAVIQLAEKHNVEILADEHYRFIPHTSEIDILPSLHGRSPNVVALGSPGKCFGCIGLRIGWLVSSPEVIQACHTFKDYTTHTVCSINDFLAKEALLNWQKILPTYRRYVTQNLFQFQQLINQHNDVVDWIKPDAGTVAFPFLKDPSISSLKFAQQLIEDTGVLVLPGEAFDMPGFFRIRFGIPPEQFNRAMSAFAKVLSEY
jgi:aspartate/methionine/tyrosine aminotransferase